MYRLFVMIFCMLILVSPADAAKRKKHKHYHNHHSASMSCVPGELKRLINTISSKFGRVTVISTHRKGARIKGSGKRSLHASCRAVDFNPARGTYKQVLSYLKKNWRGGVGSYSGRHHHIHVDNGGRYRWHN